MKDLLEIALSGFWSFVGAYMLATLPIHYTFKCWNRWLRSRNIKHHGWPPPHLDADGDFASQPETKTPES